MTRKARLLTVDNSERRSISDDDDEYYICNIIALCEMRLLSVDTLGLVAGWISAM